MSPAALPANSPATLPARARAAAIFLLAVPALVYLAALRCFAVNVPTGDDFFAIFGFLERWQSRGPGLAGSLRLLFEQFYSHRIPFTRLVIIAQQTLAGHCDLRLLLVVAWAGWLLMLASLAARNWTARIGVLWLVPLSLLLMQPQGSTNLLVPTGSPGHPWTVLLAFWALQLPEKASRARHVGAFLLATGAALCTANGLLVFPVLALVAFFRRQWSRGIVWSVAGATMWAWYLAGYSVAEQPFVHQAFSPLALLDHMAVMTGAVINFGTLSLSVVRIAGLLLLAAAGWTCWRGRRGEGAFLLFLLLSIAMTAYARLGWADDYMLQDRYRPYGLLVVAVLYLAHAGALAPARRKIAASVALPVALGFNVLSYAQQWSDLLFIRHWSEATAMNLSFGRAMPLPSAPEQAPAAAAMLTGIVQRGRWHPPQLLSAADLAMIRALAGIAPSGAAWRGVRSPAVGGYVLEPVAPVSGETTPDFGVIFQDGNPLVLPVLAPRARVAEIPRRGSFLGEGYRFVVPENVYAPGRHGLHALRRQADGTLVAVWSTTVVCP